jgi:fumarate reductase flavoprotein subunit
MRNNWDMETGVLVIGAGGCGLAAAIAAHDTGAEVAVVEKLERAGGNTALSSGSVPGAGSRFQQEAGIEDSPDRLYDDLMRQSGPHDCPELTRLLCNQSASLVEWLADVVQARIALVTAYRHVGHTVNRLHAPVSRRGQDLLDDLLAATESRGIPVALGNPVARLLTDDSGAVVGALVRDTRGAESCIGAKKMILATNGYAADRDLLREFCPEIAEADYYGALGSTGEAVAWGRELGAALGNMAAYQGHAAVAPAQGGPLTWTVIEKGGIVVNDRGERFGNEDAGYSGFAREVIAQGERAYAVFDQRIAEIAEQEDKYRELRGMGGVKTGTDAAEIAAAYDLDGTTLAQTIKIYNAAARGEREDPFGRRDFQMAPLQPPFVITRIAAGLFHTQGGLKVDGHARVLRPDGSVIPNLFAGGGAAAGISGRGGGGGYCSGNGLLAALGLGRIAGRAAAAEIEGGV